MLMEHFWWIASLLRAPMCATTRPPLAPSAGASRLISSPRYLPPSDDRDVLFVVNACASRSKVGGGWWLDQSQGAGHEAERFRCQEWASLGALPPRILEQPSDVVEAVDQYASSQAQPAASHYGAAQLLLAFSGSMAISTAPLPQQATTLWPPIFDWRLH
jgi:hypothetical protein